MSEVPLYRCACAYQECSLANCTCASDGTSSGPDDCGCGCDYEVCSDPAPDINLTPPWSFNATPQTLRASDGTASGPDDCGCDYEARHTLNPP